MNLAIIMGRLGRDPEVRSFQNGGRVANLSVATDRSWKDKNTGERKKHTEWHRVTILADGLISLVERHCRKGQRIMVRGEIETRKWQDQSGQDRYSTEIVIRPYGGTVDIVDWPEDGEGGGGGSYAGNHGNGMPGNGDIGDDIPFRMEYR